VMMVDRMVSLKVEMMVALMALMLVD